MKSGTKSEACYLELAKQKVEQQLGWGSSESWSHADFLEMSDRILEVTGISLSVTTLKRLWGKVNYSGKPSGSTLNALAHYLGYDNWREFKHQQDNITSESLLTAPPAQKETMHDEPAAVVHTRPSGDRKKLLVPFLTVMLLAAAGILFYSAKEKDASQVAVGAVVFNSEPLASGIPNTVVFNYDLSDFEFDSAFIQQNWDPNRRERISRENRQHTSVYYYPGHFHAKLVVNNRVVKEHGLLVPTEGWLGIVDRDEYTMPLYILPAQLMDGGEMKAQAAVLESRKVDTSKDFYVTYANARDFGVTGDNFTLEASVKNDPAAGGHLCQELMILLDGEEGVMWFSFSAPGCVGNISQHFGEVHISGRSNDLSAFGTDLSEWNRVKCVVKDKHVDLYLNDRMIHTQTYQEPIGNIMGINLKFHGAGAVDYLQLLDEAGAPVYTDNFNSAVAAD